MRADKEEKKYRTRRKRIREEADWTEMKHVTMGKEAENTSMVNDRMGRERRKDIIQRALKCVRGSVFCKNSAHESRCFHLCTAADLMLLCFTLHSLNVIWLTCRQECPCHFSNVEFRILLQSMLASGLRSVTDGYPCSNFAHPMTGHSHVARWPTTERGSCERGKGCMGSRLTWI